MKRHFTLLLLVVCSLQLSFANGYKIDIEAPQLKNETVNLGMYFYGKLYSKDTVQLDNKGQGSFIKSQPLHEGMYTVYFLGSKVVDILVSDDQQFKVKIDTTDLVNGVHITGAEQSEAFQNYIKFIAGKRTEVEKISARYEKLMDDPDAVAKRKEEISVIDKEVEAYQQNIINTYGDKTFGVIIKALIPAKVPDMVEETNDTIRQQKQYYYNRAHYFDNINLSDPRLVYTAFLSQKVDFYVEKMLPQIPDTITTEVVKIIEKTRGDTLTYQNMLTTMLNYAIKNNLMGMDRLTLTLSEKYYLSGLAPWADKKLLEDLEKEVRKTKHNQIGAPAPNLFVQTFDGKKISISDLPHDFVLIYFYEPSCGHCKKETPELYNTVFQKWKANNYFQVFAFYLQEDKEEWKKFIDEHKLYDWLNVWDPTRTSNFWYFYDTSVTPGLYLLNKERKIIAKKIDLKTLDMILEKEQERNKK